MIQGILFLWYTWNLQHCKKVYLGMEWNYFQSEETNEKVIVCPLLLHRLKQRIYVNSLQVEFSLFYLY